MTDYMRMNEILHSAIGIGLLSICILLYIGLRPIFILGTLALGIFLTDYLLYPFIYLYKAFVQWLPLLFELNILNAMIVLCRILNFSGFLSFILLSICVIRNLTVIYCRHLPIDDHHRLYIENKVQMLSKLLFQLVTDLYRRIRQLFNDTDDNELERFQLDQLNSAESMTQEHDETIQRFQRLADELSPSTMPNLICSLNSTPPVRHYHQRVLQQPTIEPTSHTFTTPVHVNSSKEKSLHSAITESYTGPMTRNRTKTDGKH